MAAVAIFSFQGHWNDFFTPLIYLLDRSKYTLALGLRTFQGQYDTDYHLLMAAAFVVMLPILLVFFFAQKYFIQGVVFTGVKG
jgi:ABC-type glycerol-3-phosphate transport system permease component